MCGCVAEQRSAPGSVQGAAGVRVPRQAWRNRRARDAPPALWHAAPRPPAHACPRRPCPCRLCAVMLDCLGRELMIKRKYGVDENGWPGIFEQLHIKQGQRVTITTDTSLDCTNEVLPITYPKFPAMCEVCCTCCTMQYRTLHAVLRRGLLVPHRRLPPSTCIARALCAPRVPCAPGTASRRPPPPPPPRPRPRCSPATRSSWGATWPPAQTTPPFSSRCGRKKAAQQAGLRAALGRRAAAWLAGRPAGGGVAPRALRWRSPQRAPRPAATHPCAPAPAPAPA